MIVAQGIAQQLGPLGDRLAVDEDSRPYLLHELVNRQWTRRCADQAHEKSERQLRQRDLVDATEHQVPANVDGQVVYAPDFITALVHWSTFPIATLAREHRIAAIDVGFDPTDREARWAGLIQQITPPLASLWQTFT